MRYVERTYGRYALVNIRRTLLQHNVRKDAVT